MGQIWHPHSSPHMVDRLHEIPTLQDTSREEDKGLYGKKEFSERLAQLRKAARSSVLKTSRQRSA